MLMNYLKLTMIRYSSKSELNKAMFDKAIYLIAKSVFIDKVVDTRKSIKHVRFIRINK